MKQWKEGETTSMKPPRIRIKKIIRGINQEKGDDWKAVPNTDGLYWINRSGRIFSAMRQIFLRIQYPSNCSPTLRLPLNGIFRTVGVARTVATLFLGEQKPGYKLIFKDHDSQNVDLSNLDYIPTRKERQRQSKKRMRP